VGSYGGNAGKRSFPLATVTRDGVFFEDSSIRFQDVTDGTSNTLLFGERSHLDPEFDRLAFGTVWYGLVKYGRWAMVFTTGGGNLPQHLLSTPVPINYRVPIGIPLEEFLGPTGAENNRLCASGSSHPGGANFAFADGSVRFLNNQTDLATLQALSTRAGGEVIDGSGF
jgi:prepilin-type processing-associated H-X9-DG protein